MTTATADNWPSHEYRFQTMEIGESHFKFRRDIKAVRSAWRLYRRNHPEVQTWEIECVERASGVVYVRTK